MPKLVNKIDAEMNTFLKTVNYINVVFDGWTDVAKMHYIIVLLVADGRVFYAENLEFETFEHHDAPNMAYKLETMLHDVAPDVNRIVSIFKII